VLKELKRRMDRSHDPKPNEMKNLLNLTNEVLGNNGFPNPRDLFEAYGYVYYFQGQYEKSVYNFGEALGLLMDEEKGRLQRSFDKAKAHMDETRKREIIEGEYLKAKNYFKEKKYHKVIQSCERVLMLDPNHEEARRHLEYAKQQLQAPIDQAMRLAKERITAHHYLDGIKYLNKVRALDPSNLEATRLMRKAIRALEKGQVKQGEGRVVRLIDRNILRSQKLYSQGLQLYSQGNLQGAMVSWKQAFEYDKGNKAAENAYHRVLREIQHNGHNP